MKAIILAPYKDHIFNKDRPLALIKICGVSLLVRILNSIKAAGIKDVLIVVGFKGEDIANMLKNGEEIKMNISYIEAKNSEIPSIPSGFLDSDLLILRSDIVIDAEFANEIVKIKENAICYSNGEFIGVCKITKEDLNIVKMEKTLDEIVKTLEARQNVIKLNVSGMKVEHVELKREVFPTCVKIKDKNSIKFAKKKLIFRTQKGLHFTSYINKPIEDRLVYLISDISRITPNRITIFANLAAFFVASLFLSGYLKIAAVLAYIVGIIDGLDGKLARARGILTKLGYIEHSFDMLYEQVWYVSFAISLYLLGYGYLPLVLGLTMLVADSFVRHCYMQFRQTMGKALTAYTRFDKAFARVDGRRNVYVLYMIIFSWLPLIPYLSWIQTSPLYALHAMLAHSSLTALVYAIRAIQHMSAADKANGIKGFLKLVGKP